MSTNPFSTMPAMPPVQIHDDHDSDDNSPCNPNFDVPRVSNSQSSLDDSADRNSRDLNDANVSRFQ